MFNRQHLIAKDVSLTGLSRPKASRSYDQCIAGTLFFKSTSPQKYSRANCVPLGEQKIFHFFKDLLNPPQTGQKTQTTYRKQEQKGLFSQKKADGRWPPPRWAVLWRSASRASGGGRCGFCALGLQQGGNELGEPWPFAMAKDILKKAPPLDERQQNTQKCPTS